MPPHRCCDYAMGSFRLRLILVISIIFTVSNAAIHVDYDHRSARQTHSAMLPSYSHRSLSTQKRKGVRSKGKGKFKGNSNSKQRRELKENIFDRKGGGKAEIMNKAEKRKRSKSKKEKGALKIFRTGYTTGKDTGSKKARKGALDDDFIPMPVVSQPTHPPDITPPPTFKPTSRPVSAANSIPTTSKPTMAPNSSDGLTEAPLNGNLPSRDPITTDAPTEAPTEAPTPMKIEGKTKTPKPTETPNTTQNPSPPLRIPTRPPNSSDGLTESPLQTGIPSAVQGTSNFPTNPPKKTEAPSKVPDSKNIPTLTPSSLNQFPSLAPSRNDTPTEPSSSIGFPTTAPSKGATIVPSAGSTFLPSSTNLVTSLPSSFPTILGPSTDPSGGTIVPSAGSTSLPSLPNLATSLPSSFPTILGPSTDPTGNPSLLNTDPSSAPSPMTLNMATAVELTPFGILFTVTSMNIPLSVDYAEVAALTDAFLKNYFKSVYDQTIFTTLETFRISLVSGLFTMGKPIQVDANATAYFDSTSPNIPTLKELDDLLKDAFVGSNDYLQKLKTLPNENPFSGTTKVTLTNSSSIPLKTNPREIPEATTAQSVEGAKQDKHSGKLPLAILVVMGAGVSVLVLTLFFTRRRRRHQANRGQRIKSLHDEPRFMSDSATMADDVSSTDDSEGTVRRYLIPHQSLGICESHSSDWDNYVYKSSCSSVASMGLDEPFPVEHDMFSHFREMNNVRR